MLFRALGGDGGLQAEATEHGARRSWLQRLVAAHLAQRPDPKQLPTRKVEDMARRRAKRVDNPEQDRGLITVRMENIFTWGEHVNVDRGSEDEEDPERAAGQPGSRSAPTVSTATCAAVRVIWPGLLLPDLSLSTDTWIDGHHRVIDVIRDSLYLFAEHLHATGDRFTMHGFSSRRPDPHTSRPSTPPASFACKPSGSPSTTKLSVQSAPPCEAESG